MPGIAPGGGGASVTQEVELVYWKDVKESIDLDELQAFLDRFPAGIYADLARRRLRKLSGGTSPDQTILSGAPLADPEQDTEVTQRRDPTSPPVGAPLIPEPPSQPAVAVTLAAPDLLTDSVSEDRTIIISEPLLPASAAPVAADSAEDRTVISPFAALPTDSPAMPPLPGWPPIRTQPVLPAVEPSPKGVQAPPVALLAGLGAVAVIVVGIAAYWMMGRPGPEIVTAAPAPSASSAAPAPVPAPEVPLAPPVVLASANPTVAAIAASAAQPVLEPGPDKLDSAPAAQTPAASPPASAARRVTSVMAIS